MADSEERLRLYRLKKASDSALAKSTTSEGSSISGHSHASAGRGSQDQEAEVSAHDVSASSVNNAASADGSNRSDATASSKVKSQLSEAWRNAGSRTRITIIAALWLLAFLSFVAAGFGIVFFIISLLGFMYLNTRVGEGDDRGPSAYNVFNDNFERLAGDFNADVFERQLRGRNVIR